MFDFLLQNFPLNIWQVLIRVVAAIAIGAIIGSERARHGRAAGIRTHLLVCLGSTMTALTSVYINEIMGMGGDIARLPAQVISGVGFLGAGMIILKSNSIITGLTTAAGVWTTATIGIALGYGFYFGAAAVTAFFVLAVILFSKLEKHRKKTGGVYIEIDDMYKTNEIINEIEKLIPTGFSYQITAPKSGHVGNLGIDIVILKFKDSDVEQLKAIDNVVFVADE